VANLAVQHLKMFRMELLGQSFELGRGDPSASISSKARGSRRAAPIIRSTYVIEHFRAAIRQCLPRGYLEPRGHEADQDQRTGHDFQAVFDRV
jgi:hypothetical protein